MDCDEAASSNHSSEDETAAAAATYLQHTLTLVKSRLYQTRINAADRHIFHFSTPTSVEGGNEIGEELGFSVLY